MFKVLQDLYHQRYGFGFTVSQNLRPRFLKNISARVYVGLSGAEGG